MSDYSETSSNLNEVIAELNEAGNCPRFNNVYLLSLEAINILGNALGVDVNLWGEETFQLKILGQTFEIPECLTSRGSLDFLGFNPTQVEELWDFLKELDPRISPMAPVDEFKNRMIEYLNDRISSINLRDEEGKLKSSADLLDALGLTYDTRSQLEELTSAPGAAGAAAEIIRETHPDFILALAKGYILHRFKFLQELNSLVVSQQEEWQEKLVKEFTQLPIMSLQAAAALDVGSSLLDS